MTIQELINKHKPETLIDGERISEIVETHISWVLLGDLFVYKVKKPVKMSFLDFSTLELREHFCNREVELNQRLAPAIYLGVISLTENSFSDEGERGRIIDYAVKMKRLPNDLEMRRMLRDGSVTADQMMRIARIISTFHQSAERIIDKVTTADLFDDFKDISQIKNFTEKQLGSEAVEQLHNVVKIAETFTTKYRKQIDQRSHAGMVRDVHGDLHSGNIFLTDPPIIFDCIEFNDHFRQIDMLNEIAFFCMDLEFYGQADLSQLFVAEYIRLLDLPYDAFEKMLFLFYKFYRANVKTKINAIKAIQENSGHRNKHRESLFSAYFSLMLRYGDQLSGLI
ncbi:MAG: hypothetical protein KDC53_20820 [Saprospiraceae bacterium]|nr:hypothetical protein [Saprospiraceae bacterium]